MSRLTPTRSVLLCLAAIATFVAIGAAQALGPPPAAAVRTVQTSAR